MIEAARELCYEAGQVSNCSIAELPNCGIAELSAELAFGNFQFRSSVIEGMAGPAGFEPATLGLEIRCSIELSYGPALSSLYPRAQTD
jgi:hypothetical protein